MSCISNPHPTRAHARTPCTHLQPQFPLLPWDTTFIIYTQGFSGYFAGVSLCHLALRLFGLCEKTQAFHPLGTHSCRICISAFFSHLKPDVSAKDRNSGEKWVFACETGKKNPRCLKIGIPGTLADTPPSTWLSSTPFFKLTAGTYALIFSSAWQIFPFELSGRTCQLFQHGTFEFCTCVVFISFDCVSRALLGLLLKWSPLVILNHE